MPLFGPLRIGKTAVQLLRSAKRSQFFLGWLLIVITSLIPIVLSLILENATTIQNQPVALIYTTKTDGVSLSYYLTFALVHIFVCLAANFFVHEAIQLAHSAQMYRLFRRHHLLAFSTVTVAFLSILYFFDSYLEFISYDLIRVGTAEISGMLFESRIPFSSVPLFFLFPIVLVVVAFYPAASIMLVIFILAKNMRVGARKNLDESLAIYGRRFQFIYFLMILLFTSSSIATIFYMRVPFSYVSSDSAEYLATLTSGYNIWVVVFFMILITTFFFSYLSFSKALRTANKDVDTSINGERYAKIDAVLQGHFFLKENSVLALGAFSPVLTLLIAKILV